MKSCHAEKRMTLKAQQHVTFMKYTLGTVTERKRDHYGTTSRHDKKDRKKETEASKEEETETTEEVKLRLITVSPILFLSTKKHRP